MSAGLGYPSLQNPITKSGRVVLNGKKDRVNIRYRQHGSVPRDKKVECLKKLGQIYVDGKSDENYNVLNHEIALHCRVGKPTYHLVAPHDGSVATVTSCNGWVDDMGFEESTLMPADMCKALGMVWLPKPHGKAADGITFAGIAATRAKHDSSDMAANEDDCVLQSGGMCTLYNNSTASIEVNNWVLWDFPGLNQKQERKIAKPQGVPATKGQFVPIPLRNVLDKLDMYHQHLRAGSMGRDALWYARTQKAMDAVRTHIMSRVIGRSLTRSPPGHAFDVLLGNYIG